MEYVHLLLLWMNFQDYVYIHQSFLLNIQDLPSSFKIQEIINVALSESWKWLNSNILASSKVSSELQKSLFLHAFLCNSSLFFVLKE